MKYRLKRDLPFANAGEEVIYESHDNIYIMAIPNGAGYKRSLKIYLGDAERLVREGWIEEVKPREWWGVVDADDYLEGLHKTEEQANEKKRWMESNAIFKKPVRVIKVKEVIE